MKTASKNLSFFTKGSRSAKSCHTRSFYGNDPYTMVSLPSAFNWIILLNVKLPRWQNWTLTLLVKLSSNRKSNIDTRVRQCSGRAHLINSKFFSEITFVIIPTIPLQFNTFSQLPLSVSAVNRPSAADQLSDLSRFKIRTTHSLWPTQKSSFAIVLEKQKQVKTRNGIAHITFVWCFSIIAHKSPTKKRIRSSSNKLICSFKTSTQQPKVFFLGKMSRRLDLLNVKHLTVEFAETVIEREPNPFWLFHPDGIFLNGPFINKKTET